MMKNGSSNNSGNSVCEGGLNHGSNTPEHMVYIGNAARRPYKECSCEMFPGVHPQLMSKRERDLIFEMCRAMGELPCA